MKIWNYFAIESSLHFLLFKKYFPILDCRTKSKIDNQDTENIMNTLSNRTNCSRTRTDRNWWDFLRAGKNLETSSYMYFFMWENRWLDTKTLIRLATFFSSSILSYTWYVGDSHSDKGESYDEMMRKTDRKQSNGIYWALSKWCLFISYWYYIKSSSSRSDNTSTQLKNNTVVRVGNWRW